MQSLKPILIAGPCLAESYEILDEVAGLLVPMSKELGCQFYFKASFDKANRSAVHSERGPGLKKAMQWFADIKAKYECQVITDIHETAQVEPVAEVCDGLQIPAFLCRQTDLLVAAMKTSCFVNVKKGQFMAPEAMTHIARKGAEVDPKGWNKRFALTERGTTFGYGDLVVDMRGFQAMAKAHCPIILDVTHSTQRPPAGTAQTSGAQRHTAPLLARAATATGYVDGYFIETHPEPAKAKSDAGAQLNLEQAAVLLRSLWPQWEAAREYQAFDQEYFPET